MFSPRTPQIRFLTNAAWRPSAWGPADPEEVLGKSDADFVTPDLAAQYRADEVALMRLGQPVHKEEPTQHKADGENGLVADHQGSVAGRRRQRRRD